MAKDIGRLLILRFLRDKTEKFPLISMFGMLGVLIGVFALISVISVMYGFENELIRKLIGSQPHIYITDESSSASLSDWKEMLTKISLDKDIKQDIKAVSPFIESEAVMYFNNVTIGSVVFSVNDTFFSKMNVTVPKHREAIVGDQLGFTNRILRRDDVELLSAWDIAASSSSVPKLRKFRVLDFVRTGTYARDLKYIYVSIEDGMRYFSPVNGTPTGIAIFCSDPSHVDKLQAKIRDMMPDRKGLKIQTWKDRNKRLLYSLELERLAMFITLFFIILVASFSIIVSLVLMVESKKKDFTILLSMGLRMSSLRRVVMSIAIIKGTVGAVTGAVLGTIFCFLLNKYRFIALPAIYYDTYLPVRVDMWFNAGIMITAIFICIIGAVFPLKMMDRFSLINELRKS